MLVKQSPAGCPSGVGEMLEVTGCPDPGEARAAFRAEKLKVRLEL